MCKGVESFCELCYEIMIIDFLYNTTNKITRQRNSQPTSNAACGRCNSIYIFCEYVTEGRIQGNFVGM